MLPKWEAGLYSGMVIHALSPMQVGAYASACIGWRAWMTQSHHMHASLRLPAWDVISYRYKEWFVLYIKIKLEHSGIILNVLWRNFTIYGKIELGRSGILRNVLWRVHNTCRKYILIITRNLP